MGAPILKADQDNVNRTSASPKKFILISQGTALNRENEPNNPKSGFA